VGDADGAQAVLGAVVPVLRHGRILSQARSGVRQR
jgi:hypothetical protein